MTLAGTKTEALFSAYHVGWETRNPELIASLHSVDTVFHMHDGSEPVVDALQIPHERRALSDPGLFIGQAEQIGRVNGDHGRGTV